MEGEYDWQVYERRMDELRDAECDAYLRLWHAERGNDVRGRPLPASEADDARQAAIHDLIRARIEQAAMEDDSEELAPESEAEFEAEAE
jgi:hypothetical protein